MVMVMVKMTVTMTVTVTVSVTVPQHWLRIYDPVLIWCRINIYLNFRFFSNDDDDDDDEDFEDASVTMPDGSVLNLTDTLFTIDDSEQVPLYCGVIMYDVRIRNKCSGSESTCFWATSSVADPDPGSEIRDPGWVIIRIWDVYPGSTTLATRIRKH